MGGITERGRGHISTASANRVSRERENIIGASVNGSGREKKVLLVLMVLLEEEEILVLILLILASMVK